MVLILIFDSIASIELQTSTLLCNGLEGMMHRLSIIVRSWVTDLFCELGLQILIISLDGC